MGYLYSLDGKMRFQGLPIHIENQAGNIRQGAGHGGVPWKTVMRYDYGYIKGVKGVDGDDLDVFIGPNKKSKDVWIIHQTKPTSSRYDEDKVFLGFDSREDAIGAYRLHYDHPDRFMGKVSHYTMKDFKKRIKKNKPEKLTNETTQDDPKSM